jgi:flagellar biosynthetic protein FlhB
LVSAPPLARALFRYVDIGRQVPHTLFVAVAQVLTYVWHIKVARRRGEAPPVPPSFDDSIEHVAAPSGAAP